MTSATLFCGTLEPKRWSQDQVAGQCAELFNTACTGKQWLSVRADGQRQKEKKRRRGRRERQRKTEEERGRERKREEEERKKKRRRREEEEKKKKRRSTLPFASSTSTLLRHSFFLFLLPQCLNWRLPLFFFCPNLILLAPLPQHICEDCPGTFQGPRAVSGGGVTPLPSSHLVTKKTAHCRSCAAIV